MTATVEKLVDYIKAGDAVTIEPVYKVEGFRMELQRRREIHRKHLH
ncbi:hypothetical protein [Ruminococcus sp.]